LLVDLPILLPIGKAMFGSPFLSEVNADQPEISAAKNQSFGAVTFEWA
jgi:hypothetical protein